MSGYGWLTESSLLPKKSKPIASDDHSSLFALKAVLQREKERVTSGESRKVLAVKKAQSSVRNAGVEQRAKRDQQQKEKKVHEGSKMLQIKQKVYDSLEKSRQNVGKLLVDFTAKALLEEQDQEEYEKMRQQFYAGKMQEVQQQREEMGITQGRGQKDVRERLAWQRQVLGRLRGQQEERQKVQQVFDRRLVGAQKEALQTVKKEISEQGKRLQEVRRRRQEMQEQRIRKLKKLNILPGSHQNTSSKEGQSDV